jgi:hypothetical protein
MTDDKVVRSIAIGIGLLISVFVVWFGFRLVQERFSKASTNVANVTCKQDEGSPSSYVASFELGSASDNVDCEWGLSESSLGSRATGECTGTSCTCTMTLVPPGATPSFKIILGGTVIGQGAGVGEDARAFTCEEKPQDTTVIRTPTRRPTTAVTIPTEVPVNVEAAIQKEFDTWTPECAKKYSAIDCARYLSRPDPDANASEKSTGK